MQKPALPRGSGQPLGEDPTPTYNNFIRSTLGKAESYNYVEYYQGLAALKAFDEKQSESILKQLSRLLQFGHFTIAGVQLALQLQQSDLGRDEKALMRIVQHLVLLGLGDGAAGTPLPVPFTAGGMLLAKAVDRLGLEVLVSAWSNLGNERASFVRKQAALRALAAVTRASLTSRPDDVMYVQGLFETLRGLMDKVDVLRAERRGLAHIISQAQGNRKKNLISDMRQRAEMWSLLRGAFAAARLALPRSGLYKVAQRSLSALGSSDPVCARHALALASLVARDPSGCGSFIAAVEPLLRHNVEAAQKTGSLHLGILLAKLSAGSAPGGAASSGSSALPSSVSPQLALDSESHLNLRDTWARVYLARSCAAVIQSGHVAGDVAGRGAVFWQALLLLALADPSERVALEAIRVMFGAPHPRGTTAAAMRAPGAGTRLPVASTPAEIDAETAQSKILGASWHLMMTQALEQPPVQGPAAAPGSIAARTDDAGVFGCVARRLMRCLQSRSHPLVCGAARAVAVIAESRAWFHALSGGHGHEAEPEVVRRWMRTLHGFLLMLSGDDSVSACERAAALEALIWSQGSDQLPTLSPGLMLRAASHGGFTAPPIVRYTFADPWPDCLLTEVMGVLARRLRCATGMPPELVLELAGALAAGSPCGMPREALQALWDLAPGPLAARAALQLLTAPLPPLCQPRAAAAVEVKSLAAQAEAAYDNLKAVAAYWLGEHVNSIAGEYAWKSWEAKMGPRVAAATAMELPTGTQVGATSDVQSMEETSRASHQWRDGATSSSTAGNAASAALLDGSGPEAVLCRMAEAAVSHSPLLAMTMSHLNRAILTGSSTVRVAASQAMAKVAVRSGEPYRVQCYSQLVVVAGWMGGGSGSGRGRFASLDPLGVAPVVGPALEVLDAMYAGELVLERHVSQYGPRARGWPQAALDSLRRRHEWLLGAISCAVCAVPRELFLPLGPRSRRLLFPDDEEDAEEDALNAAAVEAQRQEEGYGDQQYYDEYGQPYQYDYSAAEQEGFGDYYTNASQQQQEQQDAYGQHQDPLARYDFTGQKAAAAVELNWGAEQPGAYDGVDAAAAVAESRPGVVLYSFNAETEGEVPVAAGDSVRVLHDLGEWFQVLTAGGQQGLVPASYVQLMDEQLVGNSGSTRGSSPNKPLLSQSSIGAAVTAGGLGIQTSFAGRRQSYGSGAEPESRSNAGGAAVGNYYALQFENPEYDPGNTDSTYGYEDYEDYRTQYGRDQYDAGVYVNSTYGRGVNGDDGRGAVSAEPSTGKKKGFGGFDDFGAVLVEAKNAIAAARQQQQQSTDVLASETVESSSGGGFTANPGTVTATFTTPEAQPSGEQQPIAASGSYLAVPGPPTTSATVPDSTAAVANGVGRGTALYTFEAEMPGELSVAAGEELEVIGGEVDGWYNARLISDASRVGLIPAAYVQLLQS